MGCVCVLSIGQYKAYGESLWYGCLPHPVEEGGYAFNVKDTGRSASAGRSEKFSLVGKRLYRCDVISVVGIKNSVPSAPASLYSYGLEREREKRRKKAICSYGGVQGCEISGWC